MKKLIFAFVGLVLMAFAGLASAVVDLNAATAEELQAIKGIGPAKSKAIIEYRDKNGPFKSVEDLDNVKGFGKKTVDKLRPELSIGGVAAPAAPAAAPKVPAPAAPPIAMPKPPVAVPTAPPVAMPKAAIPAAPPAVVPAAPKLPAAPAAPLTH